MNLLGRDIPVRELLGRIEERLQLRGLREEPSGDDEGLEGVEPRVDPLSFNLGALEEHADPTRALPLHTHRGGAGQVVLAAKWAFRKTCQVFINEALSRQRLFNGHVRDSYAQLSAEVLHLRSEVERLNRELSVLEPLRSVGGELGAAAASPVTERETARVSETAAASANANAKKASSRRAASPSKPAPKPKSKSKSPSKKR